MTSGVFGKTNAHRPVEKVNEIGSQFGPQVRIEQQVKKLVREPGDTNLQGILVQEILSSQKKDILKVLQTDSTSNTTVTSYPVRKS